MTFLNIQGGYGLMGAANSGLVCCNGYERWRMHWKHPQAVDYIAARDAADTQSVVSDITREDGNKSFLLRDFVTYGDAVRIRLPYKDSVTSSNQYIWLENHQVGNNNKLDFLQYSNTESCRPQGAAGIYAYYQIGRDVLEGTLNQVWDKYDRDNLKIIPAEGYYDYELVPGPYSSSCVADGTLTNAMKRGFPNPLCGGHDQEKMLFPEDGDTALYVTRELQPWRIVKNGQNYDNLPFLGDNLDAFSTHTKINMGTNPSTNNTKTCHSRNNDGDTLIYAMNTKKNVQTTFLTGLSIEMTPDTVTGTVLVSIRWDDYNITNDCRWTGKIALKDTAILTTGNTITLAQNRTVAQTTRDAETGLFAGRTRWSCEAGSFLQQESASAIVLTENSSLVFESGSRFEQADSSLLLVGKGCTLRMLEDADIVLRGVLEVDSGGVAYLPDTVGFGSSARITVRPGGKLVVDGGTLTGASPGEMWQGIVVLGNRTQHQTASKQGTVVLKNGAVVENARCGIKTGLPTFSDSLIVDINTTGGIISAENTTFRNCAKAVAFFAYIDTFSNGTVRDYLGSFTNCTFTVDDNNLFAANNTAFLDHVSLWGVKGVKFLGCTFNNLIFNQNDRRHAIYAHSAGFVADVYCNGYEPSPSDCGCPDYLSDSCVFEGFSTAIEAATDGMPLAVTIKRARFANNGTGVRINANNFATVTECDFDLQSVPAGWLENTGLYLDNCTGYLVEGNSFLKTTYTQPINLSSTGIYVKNSGTSRNSLHRNGFTNLNYGVYVKSNNGDSQSGLQLTCNVFYGNNYDIYISFKSSLKANQGSLYEGADNIFSNTRISSIHNDDAQQITYFFSRSSSHIPYNVTTTNVTLNFSVAANACASTLCGEIPQPSVPSAAGSPNTDDASAIYHTAVHTLMADTMMDLAALEQWHAAAQPIADPYSLAETRFAMGYDEDYANDNSQTHGRASLSMTDELAAYTRFHNLKRELRNQGSSMETGHASVQTHGRAHLLSTPIDWYAPTPAQIAQLQDLAENGTGRSSVMARGVLCFFFGICYVDEEVTAENRRASAKDREIYLPVLTEDTVTYSVAFKVTTKLQEPDPWRLGAESFYRTSKPSDTIIYNDVKYRSFSDNYLPPEEMTYLREETESGRLFRYYPEFDVEVMTCDMTLQPGDTFYFPDVMDYWTQDAPYGWPYYYYYESEQRFSIVDSVSYVKGRKVIWFPPIEEDSFFDIYENFPLCFIEGVGPSYGPFGKIGAGECYLGLLLCVHHNDSLIYMTDSLLGCEQHAVLVSDYPDLSMKLYPNPARNTLHVEFEGTDDPQGTITVTDLTGVVVLTRECNSPVTQLDVSNLSPGLYVVAFRNGKGLVVRKFVKM